MIQALGMSQKAFDPHATCGLGLMLHEVGDDAERCDRKGEVLGVTPVLGTKAEEDATERSCYALRLCALPLQINDELTQLRFDLFTFGIGPKHPRPDFF